MILFQEKQKKETSETLIEVQGIFYFFKKLNHLL